MMTVYLSCWNQTDLHQRSIANWVVAKSYQLRLSANTLNCELRIPPRAHTFSRSEANALVIPERQQLEVLRREDKTRRDAFSRAQDKLRQAEQQRATLTDERVRLNERKASVSLTADLHGD